MRKIFLSIFRNSLFSRASGKDSLIKEVNSNEFESLIKSESGILLDVRTLGEFNNGHIKDSGQLDYYALDFKNKILMLPNNLPIYLYCNTGYRSEIAAIMLVKNGYTNVYNLEHGIMEWNLKNLPVTIEPDSKPDIENVMEIDEFTALVNSDQLVFIDFYAPWCTPCRNMMPMIDELKKEYDGKITIVKINADASKKLMKELGILGVPYLSMYTLGKVLFSHNGIIARNVLIETFERNMSKKNPTF